MKINFTDIEIKITVPKEKKSENLLAKVILILKSDDGSEYFSISGFTLWKSKYGGYNLTPPSCGYFKFCLIGQSLKGKIEKEVVKQYEYNRIPIVEDEA